MSPGDTMENLPDSPLSDAVLFGEYSLSVGISSPSRPDFSHHGWRQLRIMVRRPDWIAPILGGMYGILFSSYPLQIIRAVVRFVTVLVVHLSAASVASDKKPSYEHMHDKTARLPMHRNGVLPVTIARSAAMQNGKWLAPHLSMHPSDPTKIADLVTALCLWNFEPAFHKTNHIISSMGSQG